MQHAAGALGGASGLPGLRKAYIFLLVCVFLLPFKACRVGESGNSTPGWWYAGSTNLLASLTIDIHDRVRPITRATAPGRSPHFPRRRATMGGAVTDATVPGIVDPATDMEPFR